GFSPEVPASIDAGAGRGGRDFAGTIAPDGIVAQLDVIVGRIGSVAEAGIAIAESDSRLQRVFDRRITNHEMVFSARRQTRTDERGAHPDILRLAAEPV